MGTCRLSDKGIQNRLAGWLLTLPERFMRPGRHGGPAERAARNSVTCPPSWPA